jgi:hypothetical protein
MDVFLPGQALHGRECPLRDWEDEMWRGYLTLFIIVILLSQVYRPGGLPFHIDFSTPRAFSAERCKPQAYGSNLIF